MGLPPWTADPQAPEWGLPPLPAWADTFRPYQLQAVQQILEAFAQGNTIVVLEAPTGSGKTLIAELVRRLLGKSALYTCIDRGLQDQFLASFDYAKVLKGRRNYPTLLFPEAFTALDADKQLSADDCTAEGRTPCDYCKPMSLCPYQVAKREALAAPLACTNVAYLLAEANGPGGLSGQACIIVDEADRLEEILMATVNLRFSETLRRDLDLPPWPEVAELHTVAWRDWLNDAAEALAVALASLQAAEAAGRLDRKGRRRVRQYQRAHQKVLRVYAGRDAHLWVPVRSEAAVEFKAIRVDWAAPDILWRHGARWLLMSATVLNAAAMLRDLGITEHFAVVRLPSTFPVARRPIYYTPVANVVHKEEAQALPKLAAAVRAIMARHPEDRILVHVVSYRLLNGLRAYFREEPRALWYAGADLRADILDQYEMEPAAVLFAPALERGVDFKDDLCRVIVVAKLPYPNLGDPQIAARVEQWSTRGREWYSLQTLRSLVQMTGRGMRHADDWCTSYVLDAQYEVLWRRDGRLLPKWWTEAVTPGVLG